MAARKENYHDEEVILKEGEFSTTMFIVLKGKVILYTNYNTEAESVICACGQNKIFGELGPLTGAVSIYTAVAYGEVTVAAFSENNLSTFMQEYPNHAMNVMRNIARMNQILSLNLDQANQELAKLNNKECRKSEKEIENEARSRLLAEKLIKCYERNLQFDRFVGSSQFVITS